MPVAFPAAVMMMLTDPAKIGRRASVIRIAPRFSRSVPASAELIMNGGSVMKRRSMLAFVIESDQIGRLAARGTRWYATAKKSEIITHDCVILSPSQTT